MVNEGRRTVTAKEARDADLPAGRRQQIDSANDHIDFLSPVIHRDRKLVGPVAVSIANQYIAALLCRVLLLDPEHAVLKFLNAGIHPQTPAVAVDEWMMLVAAGSGIVKFDRIMCWSSRLPASFAAARREQSHAKTRPFAPQDLECVAIDPIAIALATLASALSECFGRIDSSGR